MDRIAPAPVVNLFRDMPIKRKLIVITIVTTAASLLLAAFGIIIADSVLFRDYIQRDLTALAHIIADNSTAALSFDDPTSATETLAALKARTHLVAACIYRSNGTTLARYLRQGAAASCPPPGRGEEIRTVPGGLVVTRPV